MSVYRPVVGFYPTQGIREVTTKYPERLRRNRKQRKSPLPQRTQSLLCPADQVDRAPIGALKAIIATGYFVFLVANNSAGLIAS